MKKTLLSSAVLAAIFYTPSLLAANLIDGTHEFVGDTTITVEGKDKVEDSSSNRFGGLLAINGATSVKVTDGTLNIIGNLDTLGNVYADRLYGAVALANTTLDVVGDTNITLKGVSERVDGIRANGDNKNKIGSNVNFIGNTNVDVSSESSEAYGIEAWYFSTLTFSGPQTIIKTQSKNSLVYGAYADSSNLTVSGDFSVSAETEKSTSSGITLKNNSSLDLSQSNTIVEASSHSGRVMGIEVDGSKAVLGNTKVNLNVSGAVIQTHDDEKPRWIQALFSTAGSTNATEDVQLNVTTYDANGTLVDSGYSAIRVVNLEGSNYNTFAHFDKKLSINVHANAHEVMGIYVSGDTLSSETHHAGVNIDGILDININGSSKHIAGVYAQGESGVSANQLTVNIHSTSGDAIAYGIQSLVNPDNYPGPGYLEVVDGMDLSLSGNGKLIAVLSDGQFETRSSVVNIGGKSYISATSNDGDAIGIAVQNGASASLSNVVAQVETKSADKTAIGIDLDNGQLELSGTNVITAEKGIIASNGSTLSIGTMTRAVGDSIQSLTVNGTVQSTGSTTNLTNATYTVNGSGSELGTIDSKSSSTLAFGEGTYDVANLVSDDTTTVLLNDLSDATQITIAEKSGKMVRAASGVANDQFGSAQDAAKALQDKLSITNDTSVSGTTDDVLIEEGAVNNRLTAKIDANGNLSDVAETKNTKLDALGSVSALSAMTLRHEMNSLSKRMGELRDAPAGVGAWARYYGSEMEYGAQNLTSKNNTIQVGSDYTVGDWKVGVAANYTDGESSYDNGSADNKNYGFAVYGTWFVPCGAYIDLIAKYSRMDNDFALNGMNGSYENNAFNVSAETGYRFEFMDGGLFVEPQVGVSYGRIMGDDFTAQNGVRVEQDDYDSLIGRVGVRTGFKFPKDKGLIYARVSGLYDFQGEMNATATSGSARNTIEEDLGGAWLELGVGANFNWTDNTYSYIDIERTNGGDVKENYRFNVGIRHTF